ncbi:MAG TPA: hypothetical protein VFY78_03055 [Gammaproteobacteria bacterium]|nr:hypothetical protein [Gammaproteobacteria bacterium]
MNQLIATLLDCPNLSLRVLDLNGRAIKTLNQEQLRQYFNDAAASNRDYTALPGEKRGNHLN